MRGTQRRPFPNLVHEERGRLAGFQNSMREIYSPNQIDRNTILGLTCSLYFCEEHGEICRCGQERQA